MHIPDLHEFMRKPWTKDSSRVFEFDWQGRRFWMRMKAGEFVFKKDSLDSPVWGAIFTEQSLNSGASADELRAHFVEGWREGRAGRLIALPDFISARKPVFVAINATQFWFPDNQSAFYTETMHSGKWTGDLWELPATELADSLSNDWNDAGSLPRRAWEWHRLSAEEKSWSQLAWTRGSRRELENLTRAMMHSDAELWQERDLWGINYKFNFDGNATVESVRARTILRPPSARIAHLGTLFLKYNRATLQRPPLMPALTLARSFSPDGYAFIHQRFSPPTSHHERLEAHLLLRDWLADKVSEPEAKQLLPPV